MAYRTMKAICFIAIIHFSCYGVNFVRAEKGLLSVEKVISKILSGNLVRSLMETIEKSVPEDSKNQVIALLAEVESTVKALGDIEPDRRKLNRIIQLLAQLETKHSEYDTQMEKANIDKNSTEYKALFME